MLRLLCDTNQMAFGSSSALLAVLKYLPSVNTAFTYGITDEVLSKSPLIHNVIKLDNKKHELVRQEINLINYDAVLVVSNLTNVNWYLDSKIPVFFVDLHNWWHPSFKHRIKKKATLYFTEKFLEIDQKNDEHFIKVGPIITYRKKVETKRKLKRILINLGGGQNRWIKPGVNSNYASIISNIILKIQDVMIGYEVYVGGGALIVEQIKKNLPKNKFVINNFSQDEYLSILESSEILISSPGLNAVFEGIYYGAKLVMLPPQNASQVIQLKYYEKFGLIDKGINLDKFYSFPNFEEMKSLEEEYFTYKTLEALKYIETSTLVQKQIYDHIKNQLKDVFREEYNLKINLAKEVLGNPGAAEISKHITGLQNQNILDTTVVIPTKGNRMGLLDTAIKHILKNTKLPKEIIIAVDNDDEGYKKLKIYYKFCNYIRVVHNTRRKGVSATRNFGVNFAKTSFISFLDDDDYWEVNYLEKIFSGKPFDVALVAFKKKKGKNISIEKSAPAELKEHLFLIKNPGIRGSNITISKKKFVEINGFNEELLSFNDMDFGIRLSNNKDLKYKPIHEHLVVFNSHEEKRISTPGSKENKQGLYKFMELYKNKMSTQDIIAFRKRSINIWGIDPI